ncbi:MAG: reverse transcriptase-like protein [Candidatus Schekmanbacteria bacterium]|nr:reverse transcriptase-like protein [Candidatus Schekmanbacteria bacterium]
MAGFNHLILFVNGQKQIKPYSRGYVEVMVKDDEDNLLSIIRENATLANKDIQDSCALLVALRRAKGMGANNITLYLDNSKLCDELRSKQCCSDALLNSFMQEAKELMTRFENVTVKLAQ